MIHVIGWVFGWIIGSLFWGTIAWLCARLFYYEWDYFQTLRWSFVVTFFVYIFLQFCKAPSPRYRGSNNGPFIGL